jgi:hypothetical protein
MDPKRDRESFGPHLHSIVFDTFPFITQSSQLAFFLQCVRWNKQNDPTMVLNMEDVDQLLFVSDMA